MKRFIPLLFACSVFFTVNSYAQAQLDKGNFLLNAGVGVGYYYAGGGTSLVLSGEYAINELISVGPYFGYTSYTHNYNWGFGSRLKYRYAFYDIGVRGSFHFAELVGISNDKLDLYGGAFLGFLISDYTVKDNSGFFGNYDDPYSGGVRLGLHAGARYYFTEKFATFGELGIGYVPLSLGVTFKF
jgi:hypothetical protein